MSPDDVALCTEMLDGIVTHSSSTDLHAENMYIYLSRRKNRDTDFAMDSIACSGKCRVISLHRLAVPHACSERVHDALRASTAQLAIANTTAPLS
jgi:hypothetical protein